jgi:dienelactone hydrolase
VGRSILVTVALGLPLLVYLGIGDYGSAPAARSNSRVASAASSRPTIRQSTFRFVDRSRVAVFRNGTRRPRPLITSVRYPSTVKRRLPLIVFCHGFALLPGTYTRLLDAWTRAGYVVAAPVFPVENADAPGGPDEADLVNQPADVRFVIRQLLRASTRRQSPIYGLIDPSRIAVAGHSDGGDTAFAVTYERDYLDWHVRAAIVLSGAILYPEEVAPRRTSPPLLAVQGSADQVNPPSATHQLFLDVARPKYLLTLFHAGHLGPYTRNWRQLTLVERVSIAFLNHYFKHESLEQLFAAGTSSQGRLFSHP